jgi:hypothetical protein
MDLQQHLSGFKTHGPMLLSGMVDAVTKTIHFGLLKSNKTLIIKTELNKANDILTVGTKMMEYFV